MMNEPLHFIVIIFVKCHITKYNEMKINFVTIIEINEKCDAMNLILKQKIKYNEFICNR